MKGIFTGGKSSGGGGCYITTAVCEYNNKPDDCYELTQLRMFRDEWLILQSDGKSLINEYYATAPAIVNLINMQSNKDYIYKSLNNKYIKPCLDYIEQREYAKCKSTYSDMMYQLYEDSKKWN